MTVKAWHNVGVDTITGKWVRWWSLGEEPDSAGCEFPSYGEIAEDTYAVHSSYDVDFVTPEMFGAKGDGLSDDSNVFRVMFGNIETVGGCKVLLTENSVYAIDHSIVVPECVEFVGEGKLRLNRCAIHVSWKDESSEEMMKAVVDMSMDGDIVYHA